MKIMLKTNEKARVKDDRAGEVAAECLFSGAGLLTWMMMCWVISSCSGVDPIVVTGVVSSATVTWLSLLTLSLAVRLGSLDTGFMVDISLSVDFVVAISVSDGHIVSSWH